MRIIYFHQYFATPDSSGGTRSYEMARRLVKKGHLVELITTSAFLPKHWEFRDGWQIMDYEGIRLHILHLPYSNKLAFHKRVYKFIVFSFSSLLRSMKIDCDLVFATSTPLTIALPGVFSACKHKVPLVFEVRDLWPELPIAVGAIKNRLLIKFLEAFEAWAYRRASQVIALSAGMAEGVISTGYPSARVKVIPNSCDNDLFNVTEDGAARFRAQYSWLQKRPMVLYAGTLGIVNGVGYLVDLAQSLLNLNPDIRVVVVGTGMEENDIIAKAKAKKVWEKNFYMLKPIPKKEVVHVFKAAEVSLSLFLPIKEMWNNSANKFFDTLASGTPIGINYYGWQSRLIEEAGAGLVLSPNDVTAAANNLAEKIVDERWLENAASAALNLANNRFDRDYLAGEFESVLFRARGESANV